MSRSLHWYRHYHPDSIRLDGWDYRRPAWYFVTLCTANGVSHFGTVRDGVVGLSAAGCIAAQEWQRTPQVRPYVRLNAWIVMPNHVHGLIGLTTDSPAHDAARSTDAPDDAHRHSPSESTQTHRVAESSRRDDSAEGKCPEQTQGMNPQTDDKFRLRAHSIGAIICQHKSMCTKRIRKTARPDFGWQRRYYDRIVRNRRELVDVRRYIRANPANWDDDRNAPSS